MNRTYFSRTILGFALSLVLVPAVFSQSTQTNASILELLPYWAENLNREIDLKRSLLAETNRSFDQKVYSSVKTIAKKPVVISYQLVSFIFYYPTGFVAYVGSDSERSQFDQLTCTKDGILRSANTNEIPTNCIRLVDSRRKHVCADLDLLLGIAPLENPKDVKYVRRSFRFIYQNEWKEN